MKATLSFKGGENPPNCMITGHKNKDGWLVEVWDVTKNFHLLKPLQEQLPPNSKWHKYANKRYFYSEQEFNNKFDILKQL